MMTSISKPKLIKPLGFVESAIHQNAREGGAIHQDRSKGKKEDRLNDHLGICWHRSLKISIYKLILY
jgi:hypothetical protein